MPATIGTLPETRTVSDPAERLGAALRAFADEWPPDENSRARLVWTAVDHGRERRAIGGEENDVFEDYERLRRRIWRRIRQSRKTPGVASRMILRIDAGISLAIAASLRGFYRDVIERSGDWPEAVERLLWDWRISRSDTGRPMRRTG